MDSGRNGVTARSFYFILHRKEAMASLKQHENFKVENEKVANSAKTATLKET